MKSLAISTPPKSRPASTCTLETWSPYPYQNHTASETEASPINSHTLCVLNAFSKFSALTTYANAKVFKGSPSYTRKEFSKIVTGVTEKLDAWRAGLPSCIALERSSVLQALSLHVVYHTMIIMLWGLLKKEPTGDTDIETETEDNNST
ncbi:hypothetical protein BDV19DRAFT_390899 [Aspergillus venezuelensis]